MARQKEELDPIELKQAQIWTIVGAIPRGNVASYGQVARLAGLPGYARYVGRCLKELPNDSILPWHRVINSQGKISFVKGSEQYFKQQQFLLHEGVKVINGRVNLKLFQWKV